MFPKCEHGLNNNLCKKQGKEYVRTEVEAEGWPDKRTPIALCEEHAGDRIPLTQNQIDTIMKKINLKQRLKAGLPLLMLCMFFISCQAQQPLLEVIPTNLPEGSILQVGKGTVKPADRALFKGDTGAQGLTGPQGIQGIPGANGKDAALNLPGIDTAKKGDVWVSDGKGGVMLHGTTLTESSDNFYHVKVGYSIATVTASRQMYMVAVAGTVNSIVGSLKFRVSYTNSLGNHMDAGFPEITQIGDFTPGVININVSPGTDITLYSVIGPDIDYNFAYNVRQQ